MKFDVIISKILKDPLFSEYPPVLIDVGASGEIFYKWKSIAANCICVAFDADDREFHIEEKSDKGFLKLLRINRVVVDSVVSEAQFYLTKSPFCSSVLPPDSKALEKWYFASLFDVDQVVSLPTITLTESLRAAGISYIDWFKTDTQGTDLKIYNSIPEDIRRNILAVDMEPGLIDAYIGEDKIYRVLERLDGDDFWVSSMNLAGTKRLHKSLSEYSSKLITSPCWAEITALKNLSFDATRSNLLLIVFALLEEQWGFALEVCSSRRHFDPAYDKIGELILREVRESEYPKLSFKNVLRKGKSISNRAFDYFLSR